MFSSYRSKPNYRDPLVQYSASGSRARAVPSVEKAVATPAYFALELSLNNLKNNKTLIAAVAKRSNGMLYFHLKATNDDDGSGSSSDDEPREPYEYLVHPSKLHKYLGTDWIKERAPPKVMCGYSNAGNTCYLNAVLQAITASDL